MKVLLIGPGNIEWHFFKLLGYNKEHLNKEIDNIAKTLAKFDIELVLLPDKGICFEIARKYKVYQGKKVIAALPKDDSTSFGIKHLLPYLNAEINIGGKKVKVFDKEINTGDWPRQHFIFSLLADVIFLVGISPGTLYELSQAYYLYKLFTGKKKEVKQVTGKQLHPEIVAGRKIPLHTIIYRPFIKQKLPFELESYVKKFGADIFYVNNCKELKEKITEMLKLFKEN